MIAPVLTIITGVVLGGFSVFFRRVLDSGYDVGEEVAEANELRQEAAQAGTQGIRDVRIFGLAEVLFEDFQTPIEQFTESRIVLGARGRDQQLLQPRRRGAVFVLIYLARRSQASDRRTRRLPLREFRSDRGRATTRVDTAER